MWIGPDGVGAVATAAAVVVALGIAVWGFRRDERARQQKIDDFNQSLEDVVRTCDEGVAELNRSVDRRDSASIFASLKTLKAPRELLAKFEQLAITDWPRISLALEFRKLVAKVNFLGSLADNIAPVAHHSDQEAFYRRFEAEHAEYEAIRDELLGSLRS